MKIHIIRTIENIFFKSTNVKNINSNLRKPSMNFRFKIESKIKIFFHSKKYFIFFKEILV